MYLKNISNFHNFPPKFGKGIEKFVSERVIRLRSRSSRNIIYINNYRMISDKNEYTHPPGQGNNRVWT